MNHTPGPWKIADDGITVYSKKTYGAVAVLAPYKTFMDEDSPHHGNAKLITLAPSMHKAFLQLQIQLKQQEELLKDKKIALTMDYVHGRCCKMVVWKEGKQLWIRNTWYDHSDYDLEQLLERCGFTQEGK